MEEEDYLINNLIFDFEEKDLPDPFEEDQFLLKSSNILFEEDTEEFIPPSEKKEIEDTPEIKYIKYQRNETTEEDLFKGAQLLFDDKELDDLNEKADEDDLFKPIELVEEDPLELFNKRREQGIVINTRIDLTQKEGENKTKEINKAKPRGFLANLKMEIKAKVLDKKD